MTTPLMRYEILRLWFVPVGLPKRLTAERHNNGSRVSNSMMKLSRDSEKGFLTLKGLKGFLIPPKRAWWELSPSDTDFSPSGDPSVPHVRGLKQVTPLARNIRRAPPF
jgi:hypothetical protein